MAQQWGRKETVIWPPQVPIYTYATLILAIPIALTLLFGMYAMKPFLARNYTGAFIQSAAGAEFNMHGSYRLIYLGGGKRAPRVALPEDFVPGSMTLPDGKQINVELSPAARAQGYTTLFRGPARKFADTTLNLWLQSAIFGGEDLLASYEPALIESAVVVVFMLCFAVPWDVKRGKRMKYGRLLRGPEMHTPKEFNTAVKGQGLGLVTTRKGVIIRLPRRAEAKHIQIMGDTGVGKSTLLMKMLEQIEDRGESAIVYDPAGEFVQRFYREGRGDFVLNPFRRPESILDPVERVAKPRRGPDHRRVALSTDRQQEGRVLHRHAAKGLRAPDEISPVSAAIGRLDVKSRGDRQARGRHGNRGDDSEGGPRPEERRPGLLRPHRRQPAPFEDQGTS